MLFSATKILTLLLLCCAVPAHASQEGKKFLLSFPPDFFLRTEGICDIIINAKTRAQVLISYHNTTEVVMVDDGSHTHHMNCTIRAPLGHGNNAVLVESDEDVSVQGYSMLVNMGDMYLVLPAHDKGAEYILVSPPSDITFMNNVTSMYTIAAERDDTVVEIFSPGPDGYEFVDKITLGSFNTFTNSSRNHLDYTGWKISSNGPISVLTGSASFCMQRGPHGGHRQNAAFTFAPTTDQAGHHFILPKITKETPGDSSAYIRIVSISKSNVIELPDQLIKEILNAGQFLEHYIARWDDVTSVHCHDPCFVVMMNEWIYPRVVPEGGFMTYVTPLERRVDYARFTTTDRTDQVTMDNTYLTVISDTPYITLNGEILSGWRPIPQWRVFDLAVEIDRDTSYTLETTDGGKFVAYVYGYFFYYGYGSAIVYGDLNEPTGST